MQQTEPPALQSGQSALAAAADQGYDLRSLPPILLQYWQVAMRWRLLIAAIIFACIAVGVVVTILKTPLYTASTQIQISRTQNNIANVGSAAAEASQADYYDAEFYDTQYALLQTRSLAERIARNLKLADNREFFAANGVELPEAKSGGLSPEERKQREQMAAGILLGGISVNPVKNSSLANISFTSRSPQWAERIANAWPLEFIDATIDRQFASTADARRYLEDRLNIQRSKMEKSERDLINFGAERDIVKLSASRDASGRTEEPRTLVAANLEALNTSLVTARTERIEAESKARTPVGDSSSEVLDSPAIASLRAKRAELAADYARLMVQFERGYPAARAIKSQIDSLDTAIVREIRRINTSRQGRLAEAIKRENGLNAQVKALKVQFDQQQRDTIQYNIYQREVDTNRQLYDALLQRYKEIGVAGNVGATNLVIVDPAKRPGGPSSPNLQLNLMAALLVGLALAAAAVFALEMIDEGIRNPADVEQMLQLPLLGNVPQVKGDLKAALANIKSDLAEAYFTVRTTLAFTTNHGLPRSLMVTSAQPGEGKSTTALALATTIGRTGKRVLLIDADMRSPSVHKLIEIDNTRGLSNILAGEDNLVALIRETGIKGVSALPAGPTPPSAAELLSSDRLQLVLSMLQKHFDLLVIDAPPVIGLADAPLIGQAVEGCVFVIEAEHVAVRTIRSALQRLTASRNHVFGAVVTKVDYESHGYGYGYGHGQGYGYKYGQDGAPPPAAAAE